MYDYVHDFKDGVIEKLMGYAGRRVQAPKMEPVANNANAVGVVNELKQFASDLKAYGEANSYHDISNLADSLSGEAAKTLYLLTLS